jgi:hydrogenase maturation protein HypF
MSAPVPADAAIASSLREHRALVRRRQALRVEGVVQGVGFRPYVFRLAGELGLSGFVLNDALGVLVEVEGDGAALAAFAEALPRRAPPLARIDRVTATELTPAGRDGFAIAPSAAGGEPDALVAPDGATCDACLAELADPADRRFRYPFTNCTDCGPRFTIVRGVPYDRPLTTMAGFAMCDACRAEYEDPRDRRFHAQPVACPDCGPRAWVAGADGRERPAADAVAAAAQLLLDGAIVAVKGIGGYHLACRADQPRAVAALRARKHREDKPFALLAADVAAAQELVVLDAAERALLTCAARPIVLARRRPRARVAPAVAPGARELGVMLPYSPLHHLLAADAGVPLVLTSGNRSDEPIAHRDEDALERLAPIADAFLLHDRPIHTRTDDSVARVAGGRPQVLRRSRGLVPGALALPVACARPTAGAGAELKSTFCVARGARAWVGPHVGDLKEPATLASYREGVAHLERLFAVRPELVAHDLHPDYLSTAWALERDGAETVAVQHHHAHLAAVLAEHGETRPAVGAIFDGAGLGPDGTVWGGELLAGDLADCARLGHLWPVRLPGGDRAAREPWRMACAWLVACGLEAGGPPAALRGRVHPEAWAGVAQLARSGFAAPVTTSAGRLFDAVAALCGLRTHTTYEGQAAVELEACADPAERGAYPLELDGLVLDARPTVAAVAADVRAGAPPPLVAARFHRALAAATAAACARAAEAAGTDRVVLAGGVWANRLLAEATAAALERDGLRVLLAERLPPNDGAISYGQVAVAAARDAR